MRVPLRSFAIVAVLIATLAGCKDDSSGPTNPPAGAMPDFSLQDVNPNSGTHGLLVSPRGFLGSVSAYYFGFAT